MSRPNGNHYLTAFAVSVIVHLSFIAAFLITASTPPVSVEGAGGLNGIALDLTGYRQAAITSGRADPLDAILSRAARHDVDVALPQNPSSPPKKAGSRTLGELATLFEPAKPNDGAAAPGGDLAAQIARCYSRAGSGTSIVLQVSVTSDGRISVPPSVIRPPLATYTPERQALEKSALAAVRDCAPYRITPNDRALSTGQVTLR